jgi:hypothetical protein
MSFSSKQRVFPARPADDIQAADCSKGSADL